MADDDWKNVDRRQHVVYRHVLALSRKIQVQQLKTAWGSGKFHASDPKTAGWV